MYTKTPGGHGVMSIFFVAIPLDNSKVDMNKIFPPIVITESLALLGQFYWIWFSSSNTNKTHKKGIILLIAINVHSKCGRLIQGFTKI